MKSLFSLTLAIFISGFVLGRQPDYKVKIDDSLRAQQVKEMKFSMFICWSFSTFSGQEWTPTIGKDASYFRATSCNTDQWCKVAKEAGMGCILFLTKHHDGFWLWDTKTTEKKVTNSPLGIDVLAKLRKSCDKYGIKLALYFSEGDWNWPGAVKFGNIFSLDVGPDYKGRIRDIDVKTLKQVGRYIKGKDKFPENREGNTHADMQKK